MCQCQRFGEEEYTYINIQCTITRPTVRSVIIRVLSKAKFQYICVNSNTRDRVRFAVRIFLKVCFGFKPNILREGRKEGNVLFNDALNTFYLRLYDVRHMVNNHSYGKREETRCRHMGYSFRLAAKVLLYASSHRQDNTYHGLCYTSRGVLAGILREMTVKQNELYFST